MNQTGARGRGLKTGVVLVSILVIWELISRAGLVDQFLFPPPSRIFADTIRSFTDPPYRSGEGLLFHIGKSVYRAVIGWSLGVTAGVLFGITVEWWDRPGSIAAAIVEFLRPIPVILFLPVLVLVVGIGDVSRIIVIAWACFIFVAINTIFGVRTAKQALLPDVVRSFGGPSQLVLRKAVLGLALPQIVAGARQAVGVGLVLMVASELILTTDGIGWFMLFMRRSLFPAQMYGSILIVGLLGLLFGALFRRLERRVLRPYVG
ncbi:MAG: ABC transporter permease [Acidimicrobiia bacterium]